MSTATKKPDQLGGRSFEDLMRALFNEELGALVQIRRGDRDRVMDILRAPPASVPVRPSSATSNPWDEFRVAAMPKAVLREACRTSARLVETSYRMQACATTRNARSGNTTHPRCRRQGLSVSLRLTTRPTISQRRSLPPVPPAGGHPARAGRQQPRRDGRRLRPRRLLPRWTINMSDILAGRVSLKGLLGAVACGGFSYGDVLGAGPGWAKTILFTTAVPRRVRRLLRPPDTFALGVCNGCQMMSALKSLVPGADTGALREEPRRTVRGALHDGRGR